MKSLKTASAHPKILYKASKKEIIKIFLKKKINSWSITGTVEWEGNLKDSLCPNIVNLPTQNQGFKTFSSFIA
jgi:hypothetical protein